MIAAVMWVFLLACAVFAFHVFTEAYADHVARHEWAERQEREAKARGERLKRDLINAREIARGKAERREFLNDQRTA